MAKKRQGLKGTFGDSRLAVAGRYLELRSRRRLLAIGVAAVAVLLALAAADFFLRKARLLSNGSLSSNHARFESDCASCHQAAASVTDEKCSVCHEKYGDELGVYNFASHAIYRSGDFRRVVPSEHEEPCFACHVEHEGRDAEITRVSDRRCLACHEFGSFNRGHPQFDFASEEISDSANLAFGHIHHVREVMKREELLDVERSCLYCHNPQSDGKGFEAISFDRHCDACHLTTTTATPRLPIRAAADGEAGVETLESIRSRSAPGTSWVYYTNPGEFRVAGPRVMKVPVHHRDPWILENLRQLRRELYPDAGLADLLRASAEVEPHDLRALYEEAIETLRGYSLELRSRPESEIQEDLRRIDGLLASLEREIREPYAPLDGTKFDLALAGAPAPPPARVAEIEGLVADLTQPCAQCHRVREATIGRVQTSQRTLRRAEFNHRAHILEARCLDCHSRIPIAELAPEQGEVDPAVDRAEIQNLPAIERCQECHTAKLASNRCVTCHLFHPDPGRRSSLLLYLEAES